MRLLRSFHVMAFALVLLSIVGLCIAQRSVELLLVAGALAAMSWYVTEGPRGRSLPRWVSTLLVIAVSLNVFVELLPDRQDWVQVLGRFGVWMTIIKLYERKTSRDYGQLLLLSLLLMIAGTVQSSELLFGIVLLLYSALGLYVLLLFQLHAAHERARAERRQASPADYRLIPPVKTVFSSHFIGHFRGLTVTVGATGLALSILLFLIFPRGLGAGAASALHRTGAPGPSGFADTIELGAGTRLTDSRRSVMVVRVLDERGRAVQLPEPLYLRGAVLGAYERGRWSPRPEEGARPIETRPGAFAPLGESGGEPAPAYALEVEPLVPQAMLFSIAVPVAASTAVRETIRFDPHTQLLRRESTGSREPYAVRAQPHPSDATLEDLAGSARRVSGQTFMPGNSKIAALAHEILAGAEIAPYPPASAAERFRWNGDAARVMARHLQSAPFAYTTDLSGIVESARVDPIERFLLETRRGHCEYFASALAALCHELDIAVRVVNGYIGYEFDEERAEYVIVESNAHAWCEVRTGPRRWTTVDPTPVETLRQIHSGDATLADRLSWVYQRFEGSWNSAVASFDARSQDRLATRFDVGWAERIGRAAERLRQRLAEINRAFYFGPAGYVWMGVVGLALLLAVLVLVKLMRRTRALRRVLRLRALRGAESQRLLRLGFYLDMLAVLERAALAKPPWRPPRLHARALAGERPEASALVRRITDVFYEARFGGRALGGQELRHARVLVDDLARALAVRRR